MLLQGWKLQVVEKLVNFFFVYIIYWNCFSLSALIKVLQSRKFGTFQQLLPKPFNNVAVISIEKLEANQRLFRLGPRLILMSFCQALGSRETAKQQKPSQDGIAASLNLIAASLNLTFLGCWCEWLKKNGDLCPAGSQDVAVESTSLANIASVLSVPYRER